MSFNYTLVLLLALAAISARSASASTPLNLVQDGSSQYCIIIGENASPSEHFAAAEFKLYILQISGAVLPYAPDRPNPPQKAVLIGESEASRSLNLSIPKEALDDEGYMIRTVGDTLVILGGRLRGTMYGVYTFLEDVLGCRWLSRTVEKVPEMADIMLRDLDIADKPAFEYREVFIREAMNKEYAAKRKVNGATIWELDAVRGGGISYYPFVHTFARQLVPLDQYWDTHPEYYSMIDGKRKDYPTQLCLTNPDVLRIATEDVLRWMREHPEAKMYSVSQHDFDFHCQCDACRAVEAEEGGPSGLILRFCNAIAEETEKVYPDKLIDTLAYNWSERPPKITKLRHNVRVRLSGIQCCLAHPFEKCLNSKPFVENLLGWTKITDQLYIWHYNAAFYFYLTPFPDFWQLADSAKLYKRTGVKGVYWQGSYATGGGGELALLRAYLISKIAWNPDVDAQAVMKEFCDNYYGAAGKYILDYVQLLEEQVWDKVGPTNSIKHFAADGTLLQNVAVPTARGIGWGPDANGDGHSDLYVANHHAGVDIHDGHTGAYIDNWVSGGFGPGQGSACDVAFVADGSYAVISNVEHPHNLFTYDGTTLEVLAYTGADTGPAGIALSSGYVPTFGDPCSSVPPGYIATACHSAKKMRVYDLDHGRPVAEWQRGYNWRCEFDGGYLYESLWGDPNVGVWRYPVGSWSPAEEVIATPGETARGLAVAGPNDIYVGLSGGPANRIARWDGSTLSTVVETDANSDIAIAPDGTIWSVQWHNSHYALMIWTAPTEPWLTPEIIASADELFDSAESAAESPEVLDRVRQARLSVEYVKLTQPMMEVRTVVGLRDEYKGREAEFASKLDAFVAKCKSYGMTHISESETLDDWLARVKEKLSGT